MGRRGRKAAAASSTGTELVQVRDTGRQTVDSLVNLVGRVGVGADNILSRGSYCQRRIFPPAELDAMYDGSWVVGKVIDEFPKDMVRAGIAFETGITPSDAKKLQKALSQRGIWRSLLNALRWSRLYGGALGYLNIEGQDPSSRLDPSRVGKGQFRGIRVFDRHQVVPDLDNMVSDGLHEGTPVYYQIVPTLDMRARGFRAHHTRCVRLIGNELPTTPALRESLWGAPVVARMFDRILAFDTATMGVANLSSKAYLRTIGIEGLRDTLAGGEEGVKILMQMFALMAVLQNNEGVTLLDKEDEFQAHSYSFGGLDDILSALGDQLCGASGYPRVKLFGTSPKGLNATGESDLVNYYDAVDTARESDLRDPLETIIRILHLSELGTPASDEFEFTFGSLWQLTADKKVDIATKVVTAVQGAVNLGLPASIAMRELQQSSTETGVFTNITDEVIAGLEIPAAPAPSAELAKLQAFVSGEAVATTDPELAKLYAFLEAPVPLTPQQMLERIQEFVGVTDWDPDQPRDDGGRWESAGGRLEAIRTKAAGILNAHSGLFAKALAAHEVGAKLAAGYTRLYKIQNRAVEVFQTENVALAEQYAAATAKIRGATPVILVLRVSHAITQAAIENPHPGYYDEEPLPGQVYLVVFPEDLGIDTPRPPLERAPSPEPAGSLNWSW